jgi:hypothetical protein
MNPVDWIRRRVREAGSPSEADTDRDGAFSYAAETHAFAIGLHDGLRYVRPRPCGVPDDPDVDAEPAYYKGGYAVGTGLQLAAVVMVALAVAFVTGTL